MTGPQVSAQIMKSPAPGAHTSGGMQSAGDKQRSPALPPASAARTGGAANTSDASRILRMSPPSQQKPEDDAQRKRRNRPGAAVALAALVGLWRRGRADRSAGAGRDHAFVPARTGRERHERQGRGI